jgi:uncharacterized protein (DUF58 family)
MSRFVHYYGQFETARGRWGRLAPWARSLVMLAALPGIALVLLSLLAFLVSILALLLLTVPVYRVLAALTLSRVQNGDEPEQQVTVSSGRRHIDVKIVEPADAPSENPAASAVSPDDATG